MMRIISILPVLFLVAGCENPQLAREQVAVHWMNHVDGDFSFTATWHYPEGIFRNRYGQLSCDGFCPEQTDGMKNSTGRIYRDSLKAFYQLVDTTHQLHSIQCEAWCYEWAGADEAVAERKSDTVRCSTLCGNVTHSSLQLVFIKGTCTPVIRLNSIVSGAKTYFCKQGFINVDPTLWATGILKADFNFTFEHPEQPSQRMFWKGKIYTPILNR